jgi:hypothetical protein
MMDAEVVIASELLESWVEAGDNGGAPSETRREMAEQSSGGKVGGIRRGPGGGGWEGAGSGDEASGDVGGSSGRSSRMLEEFGQGVGAKSMTVRWRQAATQVGDEGFSRQGSRPEGC